jgi:hypothetical protein
MAGGALTGSVRVVRPGRCPVSAPCSEVADVMVCGSVVAVAAEGDCRAGSMCTDGHGEGAKSQGSFGS